MGCDRSGVVFDGLEQGPFRCLVGAPLHIEHTQVPLSRDKVGLEPDGLFEGVDLFACQI